MKPIKKETVLASTESKMNRNVEAPTSSTEDKIDGLETEKRSIERKRVREQEKFPNSDQSNSCDCVTGHKAANNQVSSHDPQKPPSEEAFHWRPHKRQELHQTEQRTGDSKTGWSGKSSRFHPSVSSANESNSSQHNPEKQQPQNPQQERQTAQVPQCDQKDPKAVEWEALLRKRPLHATKEQMAAWLMDVLAVSDKRAADTSKVAVISSANDEEDNTNATSESEGESDTKSSSSSGPTDESGLTGTSRTDGSSADDSSSTCEKNPIGSGNRSSD